MAKVTVVRPERARAAAQVAGVDGNAALRTYLDGAGHSLHLHLAQIAAGETLRLGPLAGDLAAYVWQGDVIAGGLALAAGSSAIAERGAVLELCGAEGDGAAQVVLFCGAGGNAGAAREQARVHLLPVDRVPRMPAEPGSGGVSGGLHADADCPTCAVWLHENHFPGTFDLSPDQIARGIHSHTEHEIIFVTGGEIRLGSKLYGQGTALAIAANTLYGFTAGPLGLSFVNFRAAKPGDISFAHGAKISETGYWQQRVPKPQYLSPMKN
jgi:hypothetical protein